MASWNPLCPARKWCVSHACHALAALVLLLLSTPRLDAAPSAWPGTLGPFVPQVLANKQEAVCTGVRDAAERAFASAEPLMDLYRFLPADATPLRWSPLKPPFETASEDELSFATVDIAGTGRPVLLVRRALTWSWRGAVYSGYVFASRAALDDALAAGATAIAQGDDGDPIAAALAKGQQFYPTATDPSPMNEAQSWAWNEVLAWHGGYYLLDQGNDFALQTTRVVNVYRLGETGVPTLACSVQTMPPDTAPPWHDVPGMTGFIDGLNVIGAVAPDCGTMHYGAEHTHQAQAAVWRASVRPWAVSKATDTNGYYVYAPRVEAFLEAWSHNDPWLRREYLTFLEHRATAEKSVAAYLASRFGMDAANAARQGKRVVDEMVARAVLIPKDFSASDPLDEPPVTALIDRPDALRALLTKDGDPERANLFGKTLLMVAAHLNRPDTVRVLLDAHANVNAKTVSDPAGDCSDTNPRRTGRTPLIYAAENASFEVIDALVTAGADAGAVDSEGQGIADYLARNPRVRAYGIAPPVTLGKVLDALHAHPAPNGPSFSCTGTLTRVEQAVCGDATAALFDREMAANYALWKGSATDQAGIVADQQAWMGRRNQACGTALDEASLRLCVEERLRARSRYIEQRVAEIKR